jgi:YhcH/YjgK/YiaL family protein
VIYDTIENLYKYLVYDNRFALVQAFLAEHDVSTLPAGSYPLEEGVTANVSDYAPGDGDKFEAHRKFTDLQYVVSGNEKIEVIPLADARESLGYQPDIEFFAAQASASKELIMNSGSFAVFAPQDAHRPCIKHSSDTIRKIVFKIPVE